MDCRISLRAEMGGFFWLVRPQVDFVMEEYLLLINRIGRFAMMAENFCGVPAAGNLSSRLPPISGRAGA